MSLRTLRTLKEDFRRKAAYAWVKFGVTVINSIRHENRPTNKLSGDKGSSCLAIPFRNRIPSVAYLYYLLFEHWIRILLRVRIPLFLGTCVVCDRYYYDTIVDIVLTFGYPYEKARALVKRFIRAPIPDVSIFLDVPAELALARKEYEYGFEHLKRREEIYSKISKDFPMITMDAKLEPPELESQIKTILQSQLQVGNL